MQHLLKSRPVALPRRSLPTTFAALGFAFLAGLGCTRTASSQALSGVRESRVLTELKDKRIDESSGLALSRRYSDFFYTHNDSGDKARLFVFSRDGDTQAVISFKNGANIDWEDMAVAGQGEDAWVYAGDTGDNLKARPVVAVYRFREPDLGHETAELRGFNDAAPTVPVDTEMLTLQYPDGPQDCETLLATPDGRLLLITKNRTESTIYITPAPFAAGAKQILIKLGTLSFEGASIFSHLLTGGDLSPDGKHLVLRTYTHAYEWTLNTPYAIDEKWWERKPVQIELPVARQGESICYGADSRTWYATSEHAPSPFWEIALIDGAEEAAKTPALTPPAAQ